MKVYVPTDPEYLTILQAIMEVTAQLEPFERLEYLASLMSEVQDMRFAEIHALQGTCPPAVAC